jgi:hypothetical protein
MCVGDGEALFLDHCVACICDFYVHLKHLQNTNRTSGQPCLSSLGAVWTQHQAQATSLQHLGRAIGAHPSQVFLRTLRVGNWKKSWPRCRWVGDHHIQHVCEGPTFFYRHLQISNQLARAARRTSCATATSSFPFWLRGSAVSACVKILGNVYDFSISCKCGCLSVLIRSVKNVLMGMWA